MVTISNHFFNQLFVQIAHPDHITNGCVILLEGLPTQYQRDDVLQRFAKLGYLACLPHYRGTGCSDGTFLKEHPSKDIEILIKNIAKNPQWKHIPISIIASSFGGAVALSLKKRYRFQRIILLSPVISFTQVNQIETLGPFLKKNSQKYHYTFSNQQWKKLLRNEILFPFDPKTLQKNTTLFIGEKDNQISSESLISFSKKYNIPSVVLRKKEHLTTKDLAGNLFHRILRILQDNAE